MIAQQSVLVLVLALATLGGNRTSVDTEQIDPPLLAAGLCVQCESEYNEQTPYPGYPWETYFGDECAADVPAPANFMSLDGQGHRAAVVNDRGGTSRRSDGYGCYECEIGPPWGDCEPNTGPYWAQEDPCPDILEECVSPATLEDALDRVMVGSQDQQAAAVAHLLAIHPKNLTFVPAANELIIRDCAGASVRRVVISGDVATALAERLHSQE